METYVAYTNFYIVTFVSEFVFQKCQRIITIFWKYSKLYLTKTFTDMASDFILMIMYSPFGYYKHIFVLNGCQWGGERKLRNEQKLFPLLQRKTWWENTWMIWKTFSKFPPFWLNLWFFSSFCLYLPSLSDVYTVLADPTLLERQCFPQRLLPPSSTLAALSIPKLSSTFSLEILHLCLAKRVVGPIVTFLDLLKYGASIPFVQDMFKW